MSEISLFDFLAATEARDEAVHRAGVHADDFWLAAARFALLVTATEQATFTTDDVWQTLAELGIGAPAEPRALGALVIEASRAGVIVPTGGWLESSRPSAHRRPCRVWRLS